MGYGWGDRRDASLGLGIALNPIAIVVAILILGTVNTPKNGIAFAFGWISGLTILLVLTSLIVQARSVADPEATRSIVYVAKIAFGLILILAAVWGLRRRPRGEEDLERRRWTRLINEGSVARSFGSDSSFPTSASRISPSSRRRPA